MAMAAGLSAFLAVGGAARGQTGDVATWRASFEDALGRIVAEQKARLQTIPETYASGLAALAAAKQQSGDLDALLQVRAEIERFGQERSVPLVSPAGVAPDIMLLQEQYRQGVKAVRTEKTQRILALVDQYTGRLDAQVTRLTQAGNIEGALAFRSETARVKSVSEVAAAEFDRAAASSSTPGVGVPTPASVAPTGPCPMCRGSGKAQVACAACGGAGACGSCSGSGKRPGLGASSIMCITCRGSGKCKACRGAGVLDATEPCSACGGSGQLPTLSKLADLYASPAKFAGLTVAVHARVVRARLLGTVTAGSVGTASLALRDPATEAVGEPVLAREVPVATAAVAGRIASLSAAATDRAVARLVLRVGSDRVPVIVGAFAP